MAAARSALNILAALVIAQALPALPVSAFLGTVGMTVGTTTRRGVVQDARLSLQKFSEVSTGVFGAYNLW